MSQYLWTKSQRKRKLPIPSNLHAHAIDLFLKHSVVCWNLRVVIVRVLALHWKRENNIEQACEWYGFSSTDLCGLSSRRDSTEILHETFTHTISWGIIAPISISLYIVLYGIFRPHTILVFILGCFAVHSILSQFCGVFHNCRGQTFIQFIHN